MFKVNKRACIGAGISAVLRGHCSSGIRNGETKGVSPGVKCLESKGASEFFKILFFFSWSCQEIFHECSLNCQWPTRWKQDLFGASNLFSLQANGGIFGMQL